MKKYIGAVALLLAISFGASAKQIKIQADGDKTAPTTIHPDGSYSIHCDVSISECVRMTVTVNEAAVAPEPGDPTVVEVFEGANPIPVEVYTGGYQSHNIIDNGSSQEFNFMLSED